MGTIIRGAFIFINVLLAGSTILAYVSPHIDPSSTYVFSFFGLLYPFLLVFNLLFILLWLFTKKRFAFISLFTIVLGFSHVSSFVGFNGESDDNTNQALHILSFNLQSVNPIQKKNGSFLEKERKNFIAQMRDQGLPTIFCSQETSYKGYQLLRDSFNYDHTVKGEEYGTAILSRLPILNSGEIDLKTGDVSSAIWSDILTETDTLRIYNIHLRSNLISKPTTKMLEEADLQSSKTWNSVRGILSNYKNSTTIRAQQAQIIAKHASESPYKTVICGDLNDTPLSHVYSIMAANKKDSFKQAGCGIGTTYAGVIPALRIDYILTDDRLDIIDHQIHKGDYSDHYPISAQIVLP